MARWPQLWRQRASCHACSVLRILAVALLTASVAHGQLTGGAGGTALVPTPAPSAASANSPLGSAAPTLGRVNVGDGLLYARLQLSGTGFLPWSAEQSTTMALSTAILLGDGVIRANVNITLEASSGGPTAAATQSSASSATGRRLTQAGQASATFVENWQGYVQQSATLGVRVTTTVAYAPAQAAALKAAAQNGQFMKILGANGMLDTNTVQVLATNVTSNPSYAGVPVNSPTGESALSQADASGAAAGGGARSLHLLGLPVWATCLLAGGLALLLAVAVYAAYRRAPWRRSSARMAGGKAGAPAAHPAAVRQTGPEGGADGGEAGARPAHRPLQRTSTFGSEADLKAALTRTVTEGSEAALLSRTASMAGSGAAYSFDCLPALEDSAADLTLTSVPEREPGAAHKDTSR